MNQIDESLFTRKETCDTLSQHYRTPKASFLPVVVAGRLAFKFDRERGLIEWQHQGQKYLIDLATLTTVR